MDSESATPNVVPGSDPLETPRVPTVDEPHTGMGPHPLTTEGPMGKFPNSTMISTFLQTVKKGKVPFGIPGFVPTHDTESISPPSRTSRRPSPSRTGQGSSETGVGVRPLRCGGRVRVHVEAGVPPCSTQPRPRRPRTRPAAETCPTMKTRPVRPVPPVTGPRGGADVVGDRRWEWEGGKSTSKDRGRNTSLPSITHMPKKV